MGFRHRRSSHDLDDVNGTVAFGNLPERSNYDVDERGVARESDSETIEYDSMTVPSHPLQIKPAGNAYSGDTDIKSAAGFLAILPEELLVQILEFLDAAELRRLECTCKALYAFARLEDLWKALFIESPPSKIVWRGTWRSTYLNIPASRVAKVSCKNLFSDILHRPFLCAHTSLLSYTSGIPPVNSIPRFSDIPAIDFAQDWTDRPFISTKPIQQWPVYQKWSINTLLESYGDVKFRAEAVDWPLKSYIEYMKDNKDESPLYLFDRSFVEKMSLEVGQNGQYWSPNAFGEDLFSVLSDHRPDSRWLIVGPERSGSTFHKDPNATSAWNAVLKGSKYWIMFPTSPSQPPPPGVFVSEDQSEVTSPLSIAEWLIGFHAEARRTPGCMEGICRAGEVLHVPSGWWHLVVNSEPSIAITQNFVPEAHLTNVLRFLKDKPDQVSGFKKDVENPYELFLQAMQESYPEILKRALAEMEKSSSGKKRKWEELVCESEGSKAADTGAFGFGFCLEDDEDIP